MLVEQRITVLEVEIAVEIEAQQTMRKRMHAFLTEAHEILGLLTGEDLDPERPRPVRRPGRRVH